MWKIDFKNAKHYTTLELPNFKSAWLTQYGVVIHLFCEGFIYSLFIYL